MNPASSEGPGAPLGPDLQDLARCVHCGLCVQNCPTYLETGLETESPRGRLYLMRARAEGRIEATENFLKHVNLCLLCRNCEAVCPSGVPYGRIMQAERAALTAGRRQGLAERALRRLVFGYLLPEPRRLKPVATLLRFYQRTLRPLARRTGLLSLLPGRLQQMESMLPPLSSTYFGHEPADLEIDTAGAPPVRGRVALFGGCVMPYLFGDVNAATARVLLHNRYDVLVVPGATCCGSLHEHSGELEAARELARRNIDAFAMVSGEQALEGARSHPPLDAIIVNAAGCGATLKEYGELLAGDPDYAVRAGSFSEKVQDISEFLARIDLDPPKGELPINVTYQDSCHLAHAQRITRQPREILRSIPGLQLREMKTPDQCCGSAGVYNITQADMAARLLESKMADVASTGAGVIATSNPGCMLQLTLGLKKTGLSGRAVHVVELLDQSYRSGPAGAGPPLVQRRGRRPALPSTDVSG